MLNCWIEKRLGHKKYAIKGGEKDEREKREEEKKTCNIKTG